jgi:hypothetical protein
VKKDKSKPDDKKDSPEQIDANEAIARMRAFVDRQEEFVNAVKADKDRRLRPGKKE